MSTRIDPVTKPVPFGLSLTAGAGLVLMILALGFGVVQGEGANSSAVGLSFIGGLGLLIIGIVGWFATVQPFRNFDDINVAQYTGHHDASHDAAAHAEPHADDHAPLLEAGHSNEHADQPILPHD